MPTLYIWNHNSGFAYKSLDNFSTEAAICRSLVMSQQYRATPVIQIGHETAVFDQVVSVVWGLAFQRIGEPLKRNLKTDVVLTAPAGNEGDTVPRYPAALNATFPFVKSVASHDGAGSKSSWSNHGPWVTCSAVGENVESTFLHVNMPAEDGSTGAPQDFTPNSWAAWNGTSFASPKVAAQVAARITPPANASMAWAALAACSPTGCVTNNDIGIIFPF
jgi:subtilisin family serine protease